MLRNIPVVSVEMASGSSEMADKVSEALRGYKVTMQRGHGCFATGPVLEEAYQWCSSLEEACKILYMTRMLKLAKVGIPALGGAEHVEYRKHSDEYQSW